MEKEKDKKGKNKKRILNVYLVACLISVGIGMISYSAAKNTAKSVLDVNEQTIKIPEIVEEEFFQEIEETEKTAENTTVNVNSITDQETEKDLTFTTPCSGVLLKKFSSEKPIKSKTMGDFRVHNGVDIKSSLGDSVYAALGGTVEEIYEDDLFGTTIVISHDGNLKTRYSNIAGGDMVKIGQEIKKGDCIGCIGDTAIGEKLEDAHLHFEIVKDGKYVNPEDYIKIE